MDRDLRRKYEKSRERNLTDYWLSIGQEFTYSINRLSKLIGNAHELSTGRYKERLLIDLISYLENIVLGLDLFYFQL